jgi:hypothetical protein
MISTADPRADARRVKNAVTSAGWKKVNKTSGVLRKKKISVSRPSSRVAQEALARSRPALPLQAQPANDPRVAEAA